MGNFGNKWNKFVQIFIEKNGYVKVVQGLQNTLLIAVVGMIIGVLIGTIIATVRVLPKYKTLPRALNAVCSFYVGLFRGTPMVVQLLIFYYVAAYGDQAAGCPCCHGGLWIEQRRVYFRDHAKRYPVR